jgi:hypothetical protein
MFESLTVPDLYLQMIEVYILYPEPHYLYSAKAGTIKQRAHQSLGSLQMRHQRGDFLSGQNCWNFRLFAHTPELTDII